jgi:hypothetical protein
MSNNFPGGLIRKTPVTPAGPLQNGAAPGIWTLAEASYWVKQGLWPIAGNVLAVEDVFSTWLYTGNSSTQTITNGIDLAGKGGLVWLKGRSAAYGSRLVDTARGSYELYSNLTNGQVANTYTFNSNGITIPSSAGVNESGSTYASWTFREAPNFFDVVTYTGNGANRTIAHNLGVAPGMILVKRTDTTGDWQVYHRSNANTQYMVLNSTAAVATGATRWNSTTPTSTEFSVGTDATVNASGGTYVAYLFAHVTASDGFIQCGSFTTDSGGNFSVSLGWEPQWVMVKRTDATQNWFIADTMRGFSQTQFNTLNPNLADAEATNTSNYIAPNATGFGSIGNQFLSGSATYIYVAIRRGPMRTPTLGTSVFSPVARTGTGGNTTVTAGFAVDFGISAQRPMASSSRIGPYSKLQGAGQVLNTNTSGAEDTRSDSVTGYTNTGIAVGADVGGGYVNASGQPIINWFFQRAPGFMDVVCYTGTGVARTVNHNLGVVPEMMIVKGRSTSIYSWVVYAAPLGSTKVLLLNTTNAGITENAYFNSTAPTSSVFTVNTAGATNQNSSTYVAYLFASCPGVSKVGSYTGTGALQTINCAFTSGARFVLIKRTDSTGDWYVWDSARGIVAGNDPYLLLNSTAAEVTGTNYVDTDTTGFKVTAAAPAGINASGGNYIFLAIA